MYTHLLYFINYPFLEHGAASAFLRKHFGQNRFQKWAKVWFLATFLKYVEIKNMDKLKFENYSFWNTYLPQYKKLKINTNFIVIEKKLK